MSDVRRRRSTNRPLWPRDATLALTWRWHVHCDSILPSPLLHMGKVVVTGCPVACIPARISDWQPWIGSWRGEIFWSRGGRFSWTLASKELASLQDGAPGTNNPPRSVFILSWRNFQITSSPFKLILNFHLFSLSLLNMFMLLSSPWTLGYFSSLHHSNLSP